MSVAGSEACDSSTDGARPSDLTRVDGLLAKILCGHGVFLRQFVLTHAAAFDHVLDGNGFIQSPLSERMNKTQAALDRLGSAIPSHALSQGDYLQRFRQPIERQISQLKRERNALSRRLAQPLESVPLTDSVVVALDELACKYDKALNALAVVEACDRARKALSDIHAELYHALDLKARRLAFYREHPQYSQTSALMLLNIDRCTLKVSLLQDPENRELQQHLQEVERWIGQKDPALDHELFWLINRAQMEWLDVARGRPEFQVDPVDLSGLAESMVCLSSINQLFFCSSLEEREKEKYITKDVMRGLRIVNKGEFEFRNRRAHLHQVFDAAFAHSNFVEKFFAEAATLYDGAKDDILMWCSLHSRSNLRHEIAPGEQRDVHERLKSRASQLAQLSEYWVDHCEDALRNCIDSDAASVEATRTIVQKIDLELAACRIACEMITRAQSFADEPGTRREQAVARADEARKKLLQELAGEAAPSNEPAPAQATSSRGKKRKKGRASAGKNEKTASLAASKAPAAVDEPVQPVAPPAHARWTLATARQWMDEACEARSYFEKIPEAFSRIVFRQDRFHLVRDTVDEMESCLQGFDERVFDAAEVPAAMKSSMLQERKILQSQADVLKELLVYPGAFEMDYLALLKAHAMGTLQAFRDPDAPCLFVFNQGTPREAPMVEFLVRADDFVRGDFKLSRLPAKPCHVHLKKGTDFNNIPLLEPEDVSWINLKSMRHRRLGHLAKRAHLQSTGQPLKIEAEDCLDKGLCLKLMKQAVPASMLKDLKPLTWAPQPTLEPAV